MSGSSLFSVVIRRSLNANYTTIQAIRLEMEIKLTIASPTRAG
jgi:hypothetical protein